MEMGGSRSMGDCGGGGGSGSNDSSPLDGLKFGKKIYFEDLGSNVQTTSSSSSSKQPASSSSPSPPPPRPPQEAIGVPPPSGRRGRGASAQGGAAQQPPRCQVEGCGQDLTGAKAYYCRHKVCGAHSKSPKVIVAGIEQRFCQQCSRFHQLAEFDQGKRSCRRRLAGHNERRRKPPSGSFSSRYGQLSSSLHEDGRRLGGFLMDFSCPRLPGHSRDYWPAIEASNRHMASNLWPGRLDIPPQSGRVAAQVVVPYAQGSSSGTLFSAHDIPPDECLGVPNSSCALSLLSTQQWGTTAASSSRGLSISSSNYGGPSIGQSSNTPFLGNPWSSHRHETTNPTVPPGMFELRHAMEPDRNQFSGEPGVVPPLSNRLWTDHEHGKGLGPSDDHMHWPH